MLFSLKHRDSINACSCGEKADVCTAAVCFFSARTASLGEASVLSKGKCDSVVGRGLTNLPTS